MINEEQEIDDQLIQQLNQLNNDILIQFLRLIISSDQDDEQQESKGCVICQDEEFTDPVVLKCKHKFCKECLIMYLTNEFKNCGQNYEISCPYGKSCDVAYEPTEFQEIVSQVQFSKICDTLVERGVIRNTKDEEVLVQCVNPKCLVYFMVWKDADYFTCQACNMKNCIICKSLEHPQISCRKNKYDIQQRDQTNILNQGFAYCPDCLQPVEKNGGCNFMTCNSTKCGQQTYFCYCCHNKLTYDVCKLIKSNQFYFILFFSNKQRSNHFIENNPFKKCKSEKKVHLKKYEKSVIKKRLNNNIACPNCKTLDSNTCSLFANFNNNICYCKCTEKYYCVQCNKCLGKQLESELDKHFNQEFHCKISK